jgi:hypothetical protein
MKKLILIMMAFVMSLSLVACGNGEAAPEGMMDVAPDSEKYNLYVPQSWRKNSGDVVGAYYSISDKSNVSVMAYGGEYESSEDYWNSFKTDATETFSELTVITENEAKVLDGRNAMRYVYKVKHGGTEYQCMQTVAAFSNIFYVITYTSTVENYESHLEDVEAILSNFDFK